jgi:hypothetical protein
MDKPIDKAKLRREYKLAETPKGIFIIKNLTTGKVLIGSSLNLNGPLNRAKLELRTNLESFHISREMQDDFQKYGEAGFSFEIAETLPIVDKPFHNYSDDLAVLEELWIEKYSPLEEKTYNFRKKIRW